MAKQAIHLLHVEDEEDQRLLMSHHLATLPEFEFQTTHADSEADALQIFDRGGIDLVLLDYQLTQGNGLSCLRSMRRRDAMVPIVAVSGVASNEVAAELVAAGADDFLSKHELESETLAQSVRTALARATAFNQRVTADSRGRVDRLEEVVAELTRLLYDVLDEKAAGLWEQFDANISRMSLTRSTVEQLFENACRRLAQNHGKEPAGVMRSMRPILLEMMIRSFGPFSPPGSSGHTGNPGEARPGNTLPPRT